MTVLDSAAEPALTEPVHAPVPSPWRRPTIIAVAILTVYLLVAVFTDPGGYLSTDTGGKVATLDAMTERGDLRPDLGYWAEEWDDDGSLYPMFRTQRVGDQWVNVTNLPMIYLALPLYRSGGYTLALLVPMLGGVAAALGAGRIARQLGSNDGAVATWIVGIGSPVAVYSLDLWEHTVGLALMAWAVSWVLDSLDHGRIAPALFAGLAFGAAATMRQEALVYGFVIGVGLTVLAVRRRGPAGLIASAAMGLGTLVVLAAGVALERAAMGSSIRTGRTAGTATASGADLGTRLYESVVTFSATGASPRPIAMMTALLLAGGLLAMTAGLAGNGTDGSVPPDRTDSRWSVRGTVVVGLVYGLLALEFATSGLSFVPGMLAAAPLAGFGLGAALFVDRRRSRWNLVVAAATVPLPLVWYFQYTGGAGPQWGGRYLLLSGLLLSVVGIVMLEARNPKLLKTMGALSFAITMVGLVWLVQRSSAFADASEELANRNEPILVFGDPHAARESGPIVRHEQWLVASDGPLRAEAAALVLAAGEREFGFVDYAYDGSPDTPPFPGFSPVRVEVIDLLPGIGRRVTTFVAD